MDDFSLPPIAPQLEQELVEQEQELIQEDVQLADAYFHPAWAKVQATFDEFIKAAQYGCSKPDLPADEYKIEDQVNKRVASILTDVLVRIQNAVEAVESTKRTTGGK